MTKAILPFVVALVVLVRCAAAPQDDSVSNQLTPLPIQLEKLSDEQRALIRKRHEDDQSTYLIDTRPVLFQIQGVTDGQDQSRGPVRVERALELLIYCLGETKNGTLVDYGWIENAETGRAVWKMERAKTEQGGTSKKIRKHVAKLTLPAGTYTLRYHSDDSNSVNGWADGIAEREFYYGITVFNLQALAGIKRALRDAGIPIDRP